MSYEVPEPILNSAYEEPHWHWFIEEGKPCEKREGRRPSVYYYRPPRGATGAEAGSEVGTAIEMKLVNLIRERVKAWREAGYPGVTRTSEELLNWWRREGRQFPLFFAQREAAETIIFLNEARADFRQSLEIPRDDPSDEKKAQGYAGFTRYACKMATGSGKTTVMGMLAAWSILNKVHDRSDARFSDVVFITCPNITIRDRLQELDPKRGEASLYRSRDVVPPHLMSKLNEGFVVVTNWHVLEPQQGNQVGGVGAAVVKRGPESDTAVVARVLGREVGGKQNILVMNDEAHHCYRLVQERPDEWDQMAADEREDWLEENKEATVWIDGLDKIQKIRGVNFCVDLSATPYYLNRTGNEANRPFPWVVCDFSLVDAIESGLVKIPQLAIRDTTGAEIPAYFNIWRWIMEPGRLTSAERGGSKAQPKPEAVLKWAHVPIAQLAGLWSEDFKDWQKDLEQHPTPPVFIIVCRNTRLAKVLYEWIAEDNRPLGIPALGIEEFRNRNGKINTIRVDSKVVHETDTEGAKNDEHRWMRFTLDTVGKTNWTLDSQGRPIYPKDFVELATKLERPLHPPGRDVRCIVSVAMLTEGWDCTTVTHIIGLRPFMSQLLCEQVVGRGLRRTNYQDLDEEGKFREEVAKVYGVPFEVIPFKTNKGGPRPPPVKRWHIHAVSPQKDHLEIRFPRVEGYTYAIRNRITVDWDSFPPVVLDPNKIPPEVEVKGVNVNNRGRLSLSGPGKADLVKLKEFRAKHRVQELEFELARALTKDCLEAGQCKVPAQALFPQLLQIVHRYLHEFVRVYPPNDLKDIFLSPYYGWVIERLVEAIRPDTGSGESPEVPRYEANRRPGSTRDVDLWTSREVREPAKSHLNYVVADTRKWEQSAAFYLDTHPNVIAFAKNSGLGFAIPYFHNGQMHDFVPDYLVRLGDNGNELGTLILEVKGYDERAEVKTAAAKRWCAAVNTDRNFGRWDFRMVRNPAETSAAISNAVETLAGRQSELQRSS
jgi:type III restriction enzyme